MGILANENAISSGGYQISNSLRFQSASSQYLSRTPSSAGNQQKHTISVWTKYSTASADRQIISFGNNTTYMVYFGSSGTTLNIGTQILGVSNPWNINTTQVFRDPSAWYHIVVAVDTTQATAANRVKVYVNGTQVTAISGTYPTLNYNTGANTTTSHSIGRREDNVQFYDGYLAEFNWIDGQALTPSSFGETNTLTGQWVAKKYTGTYGTNGFYLPFSNGTSTTTLGTDSSGNGNNWTLTNFTRSAGTSDCWMKDVPSGNGSPSATRPSSNYAVLNPLDTTSGITISNSNLYIASSGTTNRGVRSTVALPSTGLFYFEAIANGTTSGSIGATVGLATTNVSIPNGDQAAANVYGLYASSTKYLYANGTLQYSAAGTISSGTTYQVAYDASNNRAWIGVNNVWYNSTGGTTGDPANGLNPTFTSLPAVSFFLSAYNGMSWNANFGQRSFAYTPPSGFKALCTANLPASTIVKGNQYMDATLYTGNGGTQNIVNAAGFSPDMVWIKSRSASLYHAVFDVIRGTGTKSLATNDTYTEGQDTNAVLGSFNSNGFGFTTGAIGVNQNTVTYVGWQWDAGSSTVTNTSGTISSQVRANTTAGFSIVTYTGNGVSGSTIGHGLGIAPKFIIIKNRSAVVDWQVYTTVIDGSLDFLALNSTGAKVDSSQATPTSSVFSVGSGTNNNANTNNYVAYCFAEIAGFSKFTSFTGNASTDGSFVYLGFKPKLVMIKCSSTTGNWYMFDTSRNTYNVLGEQLYPNLSNAGSTVTTLDVLSNGIKLRLTGDPNAAQTYIVAAWADTPFQNSNAF